MGFEVTQEELLASLTYLFSLGQTLFKRVVFAKL